MNKKGITLVALIVTIIILLILATITISLIVGEDGIVKKTKESKDKTELTQIAERLDNASSAVITDSYYFQSSFDVSNILSVKSRLIENDRKDTNLINTMTKDSEKNIYTINYTPINSKWSLVYTLNLENNKASHVINATP